MQSPSSNSIFKIITKINQNCVPESFHFNLEFFYASILLELLTFWHSSVFMGWLDRSNLVHQKKDCLIFDLPLWKFGMLAPINILNIFTKTTKLKVESAIKSQT